jgi:DnaJ family protein C protein 7
MQVTQMQACTLELEAHIHNLDAARKRGEWVMARIALDRCLQVVKAKGSKIPTKW